MNSGKKQKYKTNPLLYVIIGILFVVLVAIISLYISNQINVTKTNIKATVINGTLNFSSVNLAYNYSGVLNGYFINQTIPNVIVNTTNNTFTMNFFITNENLLHNVSIYNIVSLNPGLKIKYYTVSSKILKPNESAEADITVIKNESNYNKTFTMELYTNSNLDIPRINISKVYTNFSNTINPCTTGYSNFGGQNYNTTYLNSSYYYYFDIYVNNNNAKVLLNFTADSDLFVSVMNPQQYENWLSNPSGLTNPLLLNYTYTLHENLSLPKGQWYFIVWNNGTFPVYLDYMGFNIYYPYIDSFNYHFISYNQTNASLPAPTGLVSYGLTNNRGMQPYCINSNAILGLAQINNISSISLNRGNGVSASGSSLQLNGMLYVKNIDNHSYNYWVQNSIGILPNYGVYYNEIDIYNDSGNIPSSLTNMSIQGNGYVLDENGQNQNSYIQTTNELNYKFPISREVMTRAYIDKGQGIWLYFYSNPLNASNPYSLKPFSNSSAYGKVFLYDPYVSNAYFLTSGYTTLSDDLYYDTEFTFGGISNGEDSIFYNTTNAYLSLAYLNNKTGNFVDFPSYYTFGGDTAEGAYNLNVTKIYYPSWAIASVGWTNSTPSLGYLN